MKYIKQLDSIRAIAVLLVIIGHWAENETIVDVVKTFDGVAIFFVLSGFLITSILFENRNRIDALHINPWGAFKNFYCRRALRIFPIYYLMVFFLFYLGHPKAAHGFFYYLTYTANFDVYKSQHWGEFAHFWSLSVEEQFYLFWPFLILFVNRKFIPYLIGFFILVGVVSQHVLPYNEFNRVLTFTCFDALGLGALLSWVTVYKRDKLEKVYPFLQIAALASFILLLTDLLHLNIGASKSIRTLTSVITLYLITYILLDKVKSKNILSGILNNKLLMSIGKISYGLYLYHYTIPYYTKKPFSSFNQKLPSFLSEHAQLIFFIENVLLLALIALFSWNFIEKPLLRLKQYFEYNSNNDKKSIAEKQPIQGMVLEKI